MAFRYLYAANLDLQNKYNSEDSENNEMQSFKHLCIRYGVEFPIFKGTQKNQKLKSSISLNRYAKLYFTNRKILDVSLYSLNTLGVKLNSFNLKMKTKFGEASVECILHGSKVYKTGGPYTDIIKQYISKPSIKSSFIAKSDARVNNKDILGYSFEGVNYPNKPLSLFYIWIYINALHNYNKDLAKEILQYDAFVDYTVNPKIDEYCSAECCAIYVSLVKNYKIDLALSSVKNFYKIVYAGQSAKNGASSNDTVDTLTKDNINVFDWLDPECKYSFTFNSPVSISNITANNILELILYLKVLKSDNTKQEKINMLDKVKETNLSLKGVDLYYDLPNSLNDEEIYTIVKLLLEQRFKSLSDFTEDGIFIAAGMINPWTTGYNNDITEIIINDLEYFNDKKHNLLLLKGSWDYKNLLGNLLTSIKMSLIDRDLGIDIKKFDGMINEDLAMIGKSIKLKLNTTSQNKKILKKLPVEYFEF